MRSLVQIIEDSVRVKTRILNDPDLLGIIESVAETMVTTLQKGGKVLFCGNGGSAADAQHLAAELSGHFLIDRPPLYAEALHANTSYLTAVANDYSYEETYARGVLAFGREGDVLVALTTSGNSPNVVRAAQTARSIGMVVVGMTGRGGGAVKEFCSFLIDVPSQTTAHIQESHITIGHAISEVVEEAIFGASSA